MSKDETQLVFTKLKQKLQNNECFDCHSKESS